MRTQKRQFWNLIFTLKAPFSILLVTSFVTSFINYNLKKLRLLYLKRFMSSLNCHSLEVTLKTVDSKVQFFFQK